MMITQAIRLYRDSLVCPRRAKGQVPHLSLTSSNPAILCWIRITKNVYSWTRARATIRPRPRYRVKKIVTIHFDSVMIAVKQNKVELPEFKELR